MLCKHFEQKKLKKNGTCDLRLVSSSLRLSMVCLFSRNTYNNEYDLCGRMNIQINLFRKDVYFLSKKADQNNEFKLCFLKVLHHEKLVYNCGLTPS